MAADTASDQTMFKGVHWGKAMMWIFIGAIHLYLVVF